MLERTFGWIQNPSSFKNLKNVVSFFFEKTDIYNELLEKKIPFLVEDEELKYKLLTELKKRPLKLDYSLLKGKGISYGETRRNSKCSGIIQAVITNQKGREYTDDWTADGFLRWGISIGLLDYDFLTDKVSITDLGKEYVLTNSDYEENNVLVRAFLSYPPAIRILNLLENGEILTKFELGRELGGLGEVGFTSIPQDIYVQAIELASNEEKSKTRANTEGTSDKYARMICNWLQKVGLVQKLDKKVSVEIGNKKYEAIIGHSYKITLKGIKELKRSKGISSYKKISKIVYWQMLATKGKDRDYIRNRRAYIIKFLLNKMATLDDIKENLVKNDIYESLETIKDEISVICAMGINIKLYNKGYKIDDEIIKLEIPKNKIKKTDVLALKDSIRSKLLNLNHRYLSLIDFAYDSNSNKDFEIQTIDLFVNELKFKGIRLGETRRPDGIIYYDINGLIIDNKSYSKGYNLPINQADEMVRYIQENQIRDDKINSNKWWINFEDSVTKFNYLFISSFFVGNFKKNLQNISDRTGVNGGAINVENLLYLAEKIKSGEIKHKDIFNIYTNDEIVFIDTKILE